MGDILLIHEDKEFSSNLQLYITLFTSLAKPLLVQDSDLKVLAWLCDRSEDNGSLLLLTNQRDLLKKDLDISTQMVSNSLNRLIKAGLIKKMKNYVSVFPEIIWKGTAQDTEILLKSREYIITSKYGRSISSL
jgi:hypothetical protein